MKPADVPRLAQEAGLIAKGLAPNYQIPVQIARFAEMVEQHAKQQPTTNPKEQ